jgi:hypothetical protein
MKLNLMMFLIFFPSLCFSGTAQEINSEKVDKNHDFYEWMKAYDSEWANKNNG